MGQHFWVRAQEAEWDEDSHPRAEDGKFTAGGGESGKQELPTGKSRQDDNLTTGYDMTKALQASGISAHSNSYVPSSHRGYVGGVVAKLYRPTQKQGKGKGSYRTIKPNTAITQRRKDNFVKRITKIAQQFVRNPKIEVKDVAGEVEVQVSWGSGVK